jgi:chemotaxis signal transduction protein
MTLSVAGHWLAVPVEQMDRIAVATRVWPVPMAWPEHVGLFEDGGELVPVLRLSPSQAALSVEQLVAVLHVRGEPVGLAVDAAGRVYDSFHLPPHAEDPPGELADLNARAANAGDRLIWLIDPDRLWQRGSPSPTPTV